MIVPDLDKARALAALFSSAEAVAVTMLEANAVRGYMVGVDFGRGVESFLPIEASLIASRLYDLAEQPGEPFAEAMISLARDMALHAARALTRAVDASLKAVAA